MKRLKYILSVLVFAFVFAGPVTSLAVPTTANAAGLNCEQRLLGIPPWYRGMTEVRQNPSTGEDECYIKSPADVSGGLQGFVIKLALNVIEIAVVLVGYIAVGFILFGGFMFLTNGSNPSAIEKARTTLLNAVIGLAIALGAVAVTNLIFRLLG